MKGSIVHENLDLTRLTSTTAKVRSNAPAQIARLGKKEEYLRRKLTSMMEHNQNIQAQVQSYESSISEERVFITSCITDLILKTVNSDEHRIQPAQLATSEISKATIKAMMTSFEEVEKQVAVLRVVHAKLKQIHEQYHQHQNYMHGLFNELQNSTQEAENNISKVFMARKNEIQQIRTSNQQLKQSNNFKVAKIHEFETKTVEMETVQPTMVNKIENKENEAQKMRENIKKASQWTGFIIDQSCKADMFNCQKKANKELKILRERNQSLEILIRQLGGIPK